MGITGISPKMEVFEVIHDSPWGTASKRLINTIIENKVKTRLGLDTAAIRTAPNPLKI